MENREVVFLETQMLKGAEQFFRIVEQIGENHDQSTWANFLGEIVQSGCELRFAFRFGIDECVDDQLQVRGRSLRRNLCGAVFARTEESGGIALELRYFISRLAVSAKGG